jgi:acetyltransferase-like isoleucine patch superfamily enzyme
MHNLDDDAWETRKHSTEPWSVNAEQIPEQKVVQALLARKANATFGRNCYIATDCNFFTDKATIGNSVKIASLATIRGNIKLGNDVSVNSMANLVGNVTVGNAVRIASSVQIFGFNHGFSRVDRFIKDQAITSDGIIIGDGCWIGAGAKIVDGVKLGSNCIVAAGAVVTKSFDAFSIVGGSPARLIKSRLKANDKCVSLEYLAKKSTTLDFCIDLPKTGYLDASSPFLNGWIVSSRPIDKLYVASQSNETIIDKTHDRDDVAAYLEQYNPILFKQGKIIGFSTPELTTTSKLVLQSGKSHIDICNLNLSR